MEPDESRKGWRWAAVGMVCMLLAIAAVGKMVCTVFFPVVIFVTLVVNAVLKLSHIPVRVR
jgi:hypothetical protein